MATSGALMMGVKPVPPILPRLEIVNEPPCISAAVSLPARALCGKLRKLTRNFVDIAMLHIAHHRHEQAVASCRWQIQY